MRHFVELLTLLAVASQAVPGPPVSPTQRRERIQHAYGLCSPYKVTSWELHEDGGSVSGNVIDVRGKELSFSIRSEMRAVPLVFSMERLRTMPDSIAALPTELYIGDYQDRSHAEKLKVGSERDKALLDLLELAAVDQLGTRRILQLDSLWVATSDSLRDQTLHDLPVKAAVQYIAHRTALNLREQRRLHVADWEE